MNKLFITLYTTIWAIVWAALAGGIDAGIQALTTGTWDVKQLRTAALVGALTGVAAHLKTHVSQSCPNCGTRLGLDTPHK